MTVRILFVCHGNICRSPMAEFIMKQKVQEDPVLDHMNIVIASAATSREETGNDIYPYAKDILRKKKVPFERHRARTLRMHDYEDYDLLIGMDDANIRNMCALFHEERRTDDVRKRIREGKKIIGLYEFAGNRRGISDPWYTGDFETAYRDIEAGCTALAGFLKEEYL